MSAALWWTVAGIIAALIGGYVAGRLSGRPKVSTAGWHGITSWALTTLLIFWLLTSTIGAVVGGAFATVGNAAGGLGTAATAAAPALANADPFASIEDQVRSASGGEDPAALRDAAIAAMRSAVTGDPAQAQDAQERAAQALARAQNVPLEQARADVASYAQQYQQAVDQAKQKAAEVAQATTKVVATGALFGFFALLLGAIASWFGGRLGTVNPTITELTPRIRR